jgi:hypothetical protein
VSIKYPAITIWQPWATLIAIGAKPFEFRSWPVPARLIGQRIAVHAGARPVRCKEVSFGDAASGARARRANDPAALVDCVPGDDR